MRILILGHREIASNLGISLLVQGLKQHRLRIALSGAGEGAHSGHPPELAELNNVEQAMCDALDSCSLNPSAARLGLFGFKDLAEQTGNPIGVLSNPNSPEGLEQLRDWAPDLILSLRYRKILYEEAITQPRLGVLNLHSGLLPKFRGVMATFHSMLEGNDQIGSTLHRISDRGIDTGEIIQSFPVTASPGRSYLANVLSLYPWACAETVKAAMMLYSGNSLTIKQQPNSDSYYRMPSTEQIKQFTAAGLQLCHGRELDDFLAQELSKI